jgi:hypothetical protein
MTSSTQTMPCNMHTDLTILGSAGGSLTLSGKSSTGAASSVQLSGDIATRVGQAAGLPGAPVPNVAGQNNMHTDTDPHSGSNAKPFNMHTDASTQIEPTASGTSLTVSGPADPPTGPTVTLELTIDGPALNTLKGAHAGL